jgi:phosphoenolpyruvate carboxykinase (GTP)
VLKWICERVEGKGKARKTAIGNLPTADALDLSGLDIPAHDLEELIAVDTEGWKKGIEQVAENYAKFGNRLPQELAAQLDHLRKRLG